MFTSPEAKGPKILAIILLVVSGVALILSLVTIVYSWGGLDFDLNFQRIRELQSSCAGTFGKQPYTYDTKACTTYKCHNPIANARSVSCHGYQFCRYDVHRRINYCEGCPTRALVVNNTVAGSLCTDISIVTSLDMDSCRQTCGPALNKQVQACGVSQWDAGCSSDYLEGQLWWHGASGAITATVAAVFLLVAAIPVLLNGIFVLLKKDMMSKVSGGVAIGFSGCSCCAALFCMLSAFIYEAVAVDIAETLNEDFSSHESPCTSECRAAVEARQNLDAEVQEYFGGLTTLCVVLLVLSLVQVAIAAVSFSFWKRRVFNSRGESAAEPSANANYDDVHTPVSAVVHVPVQNVMIVDANGQVVQTGFDAPVVKVDAYPQVATFAAPQVVAAHATAHATAVGAGQVAASAAPEEGTAAGL